MDMDTQVISRDELKALLDRGEGVKLVMAMGEWAYRAAHIPGSLCFATLDEELQALDPADDIIVYCSNDHCVLSLAACRLLARHGYRRVRRYAGGLLDWHAAGHPLEGAQVA